VQRILPQYDNPQTREWLITFLLDLGVERVDGDIKFQIESDRSGSLKRVVANFEFKRPREIQIEPERFNFARGDTIRLFFSYRYTPALISEHLARYGFAVHEQWVAASEEEGVFRISKT
jgi:hypothetical protein